MPDAKVVTHWANVSKTPSGAYGSLPIKNNSQQPNKVATNTSNDLE